MPTCAWLFSYSNCLFEERFDSEKEATVDIAPKVNKYVPRNNCWQLYQWNVVTEKFLKFGYLVDVSAESEVCFSTRMERLFLKCNILSQNKKQEMAFFLGNISLGNTRFFIYKKSDLI